MPVPCLVAGPACGSEVGVRAASAIGTALRVFSGHCRRHWARYRSRSAGLLRSSVKSHSTTRELRSSQPFFIPRLLGGTFTFR